MRTRICDQFGIEFPIFAFSHCRDVVAAVSRAGGLGVLGAVAFPPEQLEIELSWIDEHVDGKPYGVDVVMPMSYAGSDLGELEKMIPEQHRAYANEILERYNVPELPEGEPDDPPAADTVAGLGNRKNELVVELIEIEVPGFRFGIDEHASGAAQLNRMSRGDMCLGRQDDFVLRSEIQEHIRQV